MLRSPISISAVLVLSTLFAIGVSLPALDSSSKPTSPISLRMEMPDSPTPAPSPTYWNFATNGLPVSYQIAIIIDAFVLIFTMLSLCLLAWYMRRQFRRRRLLQLIHERERDDGEMKMGDGDMEEVIFRAGGRKRGISAGKVMGGEINTKKEKDGKERKKRGHVRWGSSVQGGSVDLDSNSLQQLPTTNNPHQSNNDQQIKGKHKVLQKLEFEFEGQFAERATSPKIEGYRVNPLSKAKSSPITEGFKGDPLGKTKGARLWEQEREQERHRRARGN